VRAISGTARIPGSVEKIGPVERGTFSGWSLVVVSFVERVLRELGRIEASENLVQGWDLGEHPVTGLRITTDRYDREAKAEGDRNRDVLDSAIRKDSRFVAHPDRPLLYSMSGNREGRLTI
jgi:hypothetical protein